MLKSRLKASRLHAKPSMGGTGGTQNGQHGVLKFFNSMPRASKKQGYVFTIFSKVVMVPAYLLSPYQQRTYQWQISPYPYWVSLYFNGASYGVNADTGKQGIWTQTQNSRQSRLRRLGTHCGKTHKGSHYSETRVQETQNE